MHCSAFFPFFRFPNLRDDSNFILASDYSGEHEKPEFQVLAFLLTQSSSVFEDWDAARVAVRTKYLSDGRRMAFKTLNEPRRKIRSSFSRTSADHVCCSGGNLQRLPSDTFFSTPTHTRTPFSKLAAAMNSGRACCLIAFSIIAIRNRQSAIGIVLIAMGVLCCPGLLFGLPLGLIYGWSKSRSWSIQTFMVFWTALSVLAVVNWIAYGFVRFFTERLPF